jgi:hypothetical protein
MYDVLLYVHSWLRWVIILAGVGAIVLSLSAWFRNQGLTKRGRAFGGAFIGSLHLELIIGLILYFVYSEVVVIGKQPMGAVMKDSMLRYWNVEHITTMIVVVLIAQVGFSTAKRAKRPGKGSGRAALFYTLAMLLILVTVPWPFKSDGKARPYFRTHQPLEEKVQPDYRNPDELPQTELSDKSRKGEPGKEEH